MGTQTHENLGNFGTLFLVGVSFLAEIIFDVIVRILIITVLHPRPATLAQLPMKSTQAYSVSQHTHAVKWSTVSLSAGLSHPRIPEGMRHGANGRELSQQAP